MPTRLAVHAHLCVDALETSSRRAKDPVVRSPWQVVWRLAPGRPSAPVAAVTGYPVNWIRIMVRRSPQPGPAGLDDRRLRHPGARGLLAAAQRTAPSQGGSDCPSGLQTNLPAVVRALQQAYPQQEVERWATAQHRIGLKPLRRRVWRPRGQRPRALVPHRYQWGALDALGPPGSGRTWWWFLPTVAMAALPLALAEFAQAVGAGPGKPVILGLEGAGWHVSAARTVPPGVHRPFLPPYAPAWQPAERRGPLTHEALAPRHVRDIDALQTVQADRCLQWHARPDVVEASPCCHWWPHMAGTHMHQ